VLEGLVAGLAAILAMATITTTISTSWRVRQRARASLTAQQELVDSFVRLQETAVDLEKTISRGAAIGIPVPATIDRAPGVLGLPQIAYGKRQILRSLPPATSRPADYFLGFTYPSEAAALAMFKRNAWGAHLNKFTIQVEFRHSVLETWSPDKDMRSWVDQETPDQGNSKSPQEWDDFESRLARQAS
jgi:hypothetical protein